ncbi:unnamed protein product [Tuber melanosporum]|uniref:(Perigord truffle) hypothetical protein n=1 Tax=Tuber melanosporum (strain Mel28) TaxID=656061 RepID=D5GA43_TUBMM|nr:uncharacterized protein GSTUM_00003558001 [Tuber melanosporum]CAZ81386.1 unnamed protein product [Tuber melanosporum]
MRMKTGPQPLPISHAHHAPPPHIRALHKAHQRSPLTVPTVLDFENLPLSSPSSFSPVANSTISASVASTAFSAFSDGREDTVNVESDIPVYNVSSVPGLRVIPNLLPPSVQKTLLRKLLFRDLSDPRHKTNLHAHYNLPPPPPDIGSYFESPPGTTFQALNTDGRDLPIDRMLDKKLRWVTLGGQYDWSKLSRCDIEKPLVSHRGIHWRLIGIVSLGCEALFIAGVGEGEGVVIRVRSGDAIVMSGEARWAWHSVPTIASGTCPDWLQEWPEERRGWMKGKRVNLNVRQMWD